MSRHKTKPKRLVWRISDHAPLGEWVDPNLPPEPPKKEPHDSHGSGWTRSSFDLLNGVEVNEGHDTVPDDLFDELFPAHAPKTGPAPE